MKLCQTLMIAACLSIAGWANADDQADVERLILAAEQANINAADIGFEWRDTAKMIEQARSAMGKGNLEEAKAIAQAAFDQGIAAIKQGEYMRANWQQLVPYN